MVAGRHLTAKYSAFDPRTQERKMVLKMRMTRTMTKKMTMVVIPCIPSMYHPILTLGSNSQEIGRAARPRIQKWGFGRQLQPIKVGKSTTIKQRQSQMLLSPYPEFHHYIQFNPTRPLIAPLQCTVPHPPLLCYFFSKHFD